MWGEKPSLIQASLMSVLYPSPALSLGYGSSPPPYQFHHRPPMSVQNNDYMLNIVLNKIRYNCQSPHT